MLHRDWMGQVTQKFYKKGGGGGGGTTTEYVQSPEARQMLEYMMPAIKRVGEAGGAGTTLWNVPQAPMPTQGWFSGLDSSVTSGLWEPYNQASQQLAEQLGSYGQLGSARGGVSGAGAAGLGKFWEQAGQNVGLQAWNMINPNAMAQYQQQLYAQQAPYGIIPGLAGGSMPTPVTTQQSSGGKK